MIELPGVGFSASRPPGRGRFVVAMFGVSGLLAINGYLLAFGTYREFDDEGLFLQGVRFALEGTVLYDELVVPFGPAYYIESHLVHGLLGIPATTDGIRWHLLMLWLAGAGLAACIVFALTGRVAIAVAGQCAVFYCLRSMTNEPGHPQQLVALMLLVTVAVSLLWERWQTLTTALLGASAAVLLLTKINSGAFAMGAIGLTLSVLWRRQVLVRLLQVPILILAVLVPWLLMRDRLGDEFVFRLSTMVSLAIATTAWVGLHLRPASIGWRPLVALPLGFVSAVVVLAGWALARGSSPAAMWETLVLLPTRHAHSRQFPMPMLPASLIIAMVSAAVAVMAARTFGRADRERERRPHPAWGWLKTVYGAAVVLLAVGMRDVISLHLVLLHLAIPWCWLILLAPNPGESSDGSALSRTLLCSLALMHSLYLYPVAGSQKALSTFLAVLVAAVCVGDGLTILARSFETSPRRWPDIAAIGIAVACLLLSVRHLQADRVAFSSKVPLGLKGAQRLRMPESDVAVYRELTAFLRENCDTFLCSYGLNSLYLWTGIAPPSRMIIFHDHGEDEILWYSEAQQKKTLARFWESARPVYVVTHDRQSEFFDELKLRTEPWVTIGPVRLRRPVTP